ncbi:hypothetical protein JXQ70_14560 [bacterium]|nr:hypothetical protein [bacterium]
MQSMKLTVRLVTYPVLAGITLIRVQVTGEDHFSTISDHVCPRGTIDNSLAFQRQVLIEQNPPRPSGTIEYPGKHIASMVHLCSSIAVVLI